MSEIEKCVRERKRGVFHTLVTRIITVRWKVSTLILRKIKAPRRKAFKYLHGAYLRLFTRLLIYTFTYYEN